MLFVTGFMPNTWLVPPANVRRRIARERVPTACNGGSRPLSRASPDRVGTRSLCDPALDVSTPFSLQPGLLYVHKLRERARSARRDSTFRLRSGQRLEPFAYNGRCKFPNKIGIYNSYGRSYKCLTLVYEPSLKAR